MNRASFWLGALATVAAIATSPAASQPYYTRPAEPAADLLMLERQLAQGTADEQWWLARLALYTNMGELDEIAPLVDQLTQVWPAQPVFREAKMILESGKGHHDVAVALGESVLAEFPGYLSIRANLARVQRAKGDPVAALNLMIAAIELGPVRGQDWDFLLRTLARTDADAMRVLERLEQKIGANPKLKGLRYLQVILYVRFGRHAAARALLVAHPDLAAHPELQRYVADVAAATPAPAGKP
jgi:predicted Zn-dependent protease